MSKATAAHAVQPAPDAHPTLNILLEQIVKSPLNYRRHMGDLTELTQSIREVGVLEAILVRPASGYDRPLAYELVFGERRFEASKLAERTTIKAELRDLTDDQVEEIQFVENMQRENPHPLDEADGIARHMKQRGHSAQLVADKIGKPLRYVLERLALTKLEADCRKALDDEDISLGQAMLLARIPDKKLQLQALEACAATDYRGLLSVKRSGEIIRERFMLKLVDAPFDRSATELVPAAGACSVCDKRSGNQSELFADVDSPDVCTDPVCFKSKVEAHGKLELAGAKKAGKKVLADSAAKKVFYPQGGIQHGAPFVDLDGHSYQHSAGKEVKHRKVPGAAELEVTLARHPTTGHVHTLVPKQAFEKLVAGAAKAPRSGNSGKAASASAKPKATAAQKAALAKKKLEAEAHEEIEKRTLAAISAAIEAQGAKAEREALLLVLEYAVLINSGGHVVLERHGLEKLPNGRVTEHARKQTAAWLRGLMVELVLSENMGMPFGAKQIGEACKTFGVDQKAIGKQVLAERSAAAAVAAKDAAGAAKPGKKKAGKKR